MHVRRRQQSKTRSYYKAPELCRGGLFDFPVDVWSYGCVLDELAHQRITFRGESDSAVLANYIEEEFQHAHATTRAADNTSSL